MYNNTSTHLPVLRCLVAIYLSLAVQNRKPRNYCKSSQLSSLGRLHSLVMLYLAHILLSATTDMSHGWSLLVSKSATTRDFKYIAVINA